MYYVTDATRTSQLATLAERLAGGDRRSIGAADIVARDAVDDPGLAPLLVSLMRHPDPVVRMRAADALEKASRSRPDLVAPHADALLREIGPSEQQEVRWHVAQMVSRLPLDAGRRAEAIALLQSYRHDRSRIVAAEALSALAALARDDPALREWLRSELISIGETGPPAVCVRARRLLAGLPAPPDTRS